jgi:hypothetical protein
MIQTCAEDKHAWAVFTACALKADSDSTRYAATLMRWRLTRVSEVHGGLLICR